MPEVDNTLQGNKMGTQPVARLLITMALPIIASMIVQALYNIVDSIFVSWINESALSAVSLAFPVQNIMIALSVGTATGVNALLSRSLGEKDFEKANSFAQHGIFLAAAIYIFNIVFAFIFVKPFMTAMVGDADPLIREYGITYLSIVLMAGIGGPFAVMFERLLNSTGKTHLTPASQIIGAVFNIILDPVLIFGYGPFPELGVAGAAIATVCGMALGAVVALVLNIKKNKEISLSMKGFRPRKEMIGEIYKIAAPSIVMMLLMSVTNVLINKLLISFTETAVAVAGAFHRLNSFVFFPVFGLNQAVIPLFSYNLGAKHKTRMIQTIRTALVVGVLVMCIGTAIFEIFPTQLMMLFNASDSMMEIGVRALRILCLFFPTAAVSIILSSIMQASGYPLYSLIGSALRQIVVLVPCAYILSRFGGLEAVWWSYLVAEIISLVCVLLFFRTVYRKVIAPLPEG